VVLSNAGSITLSSWLNGNGTHEHFMFSVHSMYPNDIFSETYLSEQEQEMMELYGLKPQISVEPGLYATK